MEQSDNIEIITTPNFRRSARKLYNKYPSLKKELTQLEAQLIENPMRGKSIGTGNNKFRVALRKRGEHGGFNIITKVYFKVQEKENQKAIVYLADIHDLVDLADGLVK